jgi:protein tyrosine phosphatase (PTP) superfamily phosphohydrolase (DUF442 family)
MTTMRWFRTGGPPRGTPAPGRPGRRASALLLLAAAVLSQAGCQSWSSGCGNGCGSGGCGNGNGLLNNMRNLRERLFRPRNTYIGPAVPVETAPPLEYGAPAPGVLAPAPVVTPAPGTTIPAPADSVPQQQLEAIPSAKPDQSSGSGTGAGSTTGARGAAGKANYETRLPRYRSARPRNEAVARANIATPESTSRSARGSAAPPSAATGELNPLDNLPPLDLPRDDLARGGPAPEAPPVASPEAKPAPATATSAAEGQAEVSVAPGIRRFVSLGPRLDGGSLPSTTGLDWLAEKGYKTILDLREAGDGRPEFIAEVGKRGMRYVALPIGVKTVDNDLVSRFNFEVSLADARPLYFCDTDGTRAGMMWYIRRMTVDKVDPQVANREAEELGLSDKAFWLAASAYLEGLNPAPRPAPEPPSPAVPPKPEDLAPAPKPQAASPAADRVAAEAPAVPTPAPGDPTAWRPVAAMMVTGLGIPLAYWSRSALPTFRSLRRASLPGRARQPRSLPPASDA